MHLFQLIYWFFFCFGITFYFVDIYYSYSLYKNTSIGIKKLTVAIKIREFLLLLNLLLHQPTWLMHRMTSDDLLAINRDANYYFYIYTNANVSPWRARISRNLTNHLKDFDSLHEHTVSCKFTHRVGLNIMWMTYF